MCSTINTREHACYYLLVHTQKGARRLIVGGGEQFRRLKHMPAGRYVVPYLSRQCAPNRLVTHDRGLRSVLDRPTHSGTDSHGRRLYLVAKKEKHVRKAHPPGAVVSCQNLCYTGTPIGEPYASGTSVYARIAGNTRKYAPGSVPDVSVTSLVELYPQG